MTCRTEGIILQAQPFQDHDQIATVLSPDQGMIKFFVKGKRKAHFIVSPLVRAEFVYSRSRSDLFRCRELSLLDHYFALRDNLDFLEAAGECASALLRSQMLHKPAPQLYQLLVSYLEKLPKMTNPHSLSASFYLKLLRHEGLFSEDILPFSPQENDVVMQLAYCRNFSQLNQIVIPPGLGKKIRRFFEEQILV